MKNNYVELDETDVTKIYCMNCGERIIAQRTYIEMPSKINPKEKVRVLRFKKLSGFRQKKIYLENGSYIEPMICDSCEKIELNTDRIMEQIKWGYQKHMEMHGKSKKEIDNYMDKAEKIIKIKKDGKKE